MIRCVNDQRNDTKTVWIFTNDDDPCMGSEEERNNLLVCAKDVVCTIE